MAKPTALIVWGGWSGHEPEQVAGIFADCLREEGFDAEVSGALDAFLDGEKLKKLDLIVPIWTMGEIKKEQRAPVLAAVESGVGLAGCHGGMCDAFRQDVEWQFMTGGQWVAHPGNQDVTYGVQVTDREHVITEGLEDFEVTSEQYYVHVDPANHVLAVTRFPTVDGPHAANGPVDVPVSWTRMWGKGRVFYSSLGHVAATAREAGPLRLMRRGMLWAAGRL
ncbi:MAG: ThuA domain-containing protein [Planctomycetota bacterium]|jgi:type 1 glutamine amidotransferase